MKGTLNRKKLLAISSLENSGSRGTLGAHSDKSVAANDMMGPTDYSNPIFGELTLKLMEGTGWYKVNYGMAEDFYWGKNAGWGMFSGQCNLNPMTCSPNGKPMCSYDFYAQGKCKQDTYVE